MKTNIATLGNGLRVVTTEMRDAESVSIVFSARVGSRNEDIERNNGVSHFLEHLFFKGTKRRKGAKELMQEIDFLGGSTNAFTSYEITSYYVKIPKKHLAKGADILADMMQGATFPAPEIERERGVVLEEMNVVRDDPARHVYDLLPPLIWPGQKLGQDILGKEEIIKQISRAEILDYKEAYYRPENMVVSAAGNLDPDQFVTLIERLTTGLRSGPVPTSGSTGSDLAAELTAGFTKETNQAHFIIAGRAYPQLHPEQAAGRVLSNILGEGFSSRLFLNVRERKGLAYTVYSAVEAFTDSGILEIYAGVNLDKINDALVGVFDELASLRGRLVTEAELQKAKNQLQSRLIINLENNLNVAKRTGSQLLLQGQIRSLRTQLAEVEAVTRADVKRVAQELLEPANLRMGIIAPNPAPARDQFKRLVRG